MRPKKVSNRKEREKVPSLNQPARKVRARKVSLFHSQSEKTAYPRTIRLSKSRYERGVHATTISRSPLDQSEKGVRAKTQTNQFERRVHPVIINQLQANQSGRRVRATTVNRSQSNQSERRVRATTVSRSQANRSEKRVHALTIPRQSEKTALSVKTQEKQGG